MKNLEQKNFWKIFAKNYWEKQPLLVKNFKSSLVDIDQNEIFQMLVDYGNRCRKLKSSDGFKLYIDGQILHPTEVLQFLPEKSDKNLLGYHQRMEEYFADYCLVCDELLQTSHKNWQKLQQFTNTLFSHVGFPNRFVEMGLYLGNYRKTPFGVHVDSCGVFSFPVAGHKTFRLWKPSFAKKNPSLDRAQNYNRFKKASTTMKASVKDMTYWPSSAWHIAESDGSFNATWSLGVWVDQPHLEIIENSLRPLLQKKLGHGGKETFTTDFNFKASGQVQTLSKNYLDSMTKLKNISEDELYDAFMSTWLKSVSMQGFKTALGLESQSKITLSSKIQLPKSKMIFWAKLKATSKNIYAFEGQLSEAKPSDSITKLIEDLNSGKECFLSEYLKGPKRLEQLKFVQNIFSVPPSIS